MSWHVSLSTWHTSFRKPFFVDEFLAPRQQSGRAGAAGAARGVVRGVKGFAPRARARVPCTSPRTMRAPGRPRMATKPALRFAGSRPIHQGLGGGLPHDQSVYDTVAAAVNRHMTTGQMKHLAPLRGKTTRGLNYVAKKVRREAAPSSSKENASLMVTRAAPRNLRSTKRFFTRFFENDSCHVSATHVPTHPKLMSNSSQTQVKLKSHYTHSLPHSHDLVNGFRKNVI